MTTKCVKKSGFAWIYSWGYGNMQFEKVKKKEIINSIKRDFVQNHTFYAKKRDFLQKVTNAFQKSISRKFDKRFKQCCHTITIFKYGYLKNIYQK